MTATLVVLHDPVNGPLPGGLIDPAVVEFHTAPDGVKCARCGRWTNQHIWQAVREDQMPEQDGIIDCRTRKADQ